APYPAEQTLRLSDAFETVEGLGLTDTAMLELEVKVVNINAGQNEEMVRRCKTLAQYSAFVEKVRRFLEELGDREKAMRAAITYCRNHDILKDFLGTHATEVMSMLLEEYTVEDALALMRKESLEEKQEEDVNNLLVYGMTPEQISQALKLPLETVIRYQAGK
ncbi:MAG: hypothetical protein LBU00_01910, partial [Treponema sp.]|nr:hypothetical protein [Treponema sp.]